MDTTNYQNTNAVDHVSEAGTSIYAFAEYGLSPSLALGATLGFTTAFDKNVGGLDNGSGYNLSGIDNITVFAKGHTPLVDGSLIYGLDYESSLGDSIRYSNGDYNQQSGGMGVRPKVGYELKFDGDTAGADVDYFYRGTRKRQLQYTNHSSVDESFRGDAVIEVSLFYEHPLETNLLVAGAFSFYNVSNYKVEATSYPSESNNYVLEAYSRYRLSHVIELIPKFQYTQRTNVHSAYSESGGSAYDFLIIARFSI